MASVTGKPSVVVLIYSLPATLSVKYIPQSMTFIGRALTQRSSIKERLGYSTRRGEVNDETAQSFAWTLLIRLPMTSHVDPSASRR